MATVIRGDRKDIDPAEDAAAKVESDIREFVRRDQFAPRRLREERSAPRQNGLPGATPLAGTQGAPVNTQHNHDINELIRRVSGGSMEEIDKVILELQSVRDMLRGEGERVSREIAGYASLNAAAMTAMKIIAESMTQWKAQPTNRDHDT
ncbi:MAG: hypothetical protein KIT85_02450 [Pseudolabrys sp.]|nr:hypothetical protein [Pseudolabrys sp.]MCW5683229.1 hypothetical protein [Pseudolabrys sp.]